MIPIDKNTNTIPKSNHKHFLNLLFHSLTQMILLKDIAVFMVDKDTKLISKYGSDDNVDLSDLWGDYISGKKGATMSCSKLVNVTNAYPPFKLIISSYSNKEAILNELLDKLVIGMKDLIINHNSISNSYNHLLDCLDSVDDGISTCDENGIITYINQSACDMLKSKKSDFLGQDLNSFISNSILMKVVKTRKSVLDIEYQIELNNRTLNLMNSGYPAFDKNKNLIGAIDIYRRKTRSIQVASNLMGHNADYNFSDFIGSSKNLQDTISIAKKFSKSNQNVLILGESGTGKELLAQAIHNHSTRNNGPFVAINCASYPRDLFESELFGYDEGAFTGAKKGGKIGKFELASGGTIFLDEIGELHMHLQAKLLRIIETRSLSRIGSNKTVDIDARIITATNRNLEDMILKGTFREDLFYRLKVLFLELPPLKNRGHDILILCEYFIEKLSKDSLKGICGLDEEARELVLNYDWPGNIRELENIISLSLFYCEGDHLTKDNLLKAGVTVPDVSTIKGKNKKDLSEITRELILNTLEYNNGNKKKTAEQLGISRNTVYRKLK